MQAAIATKWPVVPDSDRARVVTLVSQVYDVPARELTGKRRGSPEVTNARQVAVYLTRMVLELSYGDLGAAFGRHRTTVQHAVQRVEELRDDPQIDQTLTWLESVLRAAMEIAQ
jgi:chromosomal replication initiation ATPase DnaA